MEGGAGENRETPRASLEHQLAHEPRKEVVDLTTGEGKECFKPSTVSPSQDESAEVPIVQDEDTLVKEPPPISPPK